MNIPLWQYLVFMPLYVILLIFVVQLMRKYYRFSTIFWAAALCTVPLWFFNLHGWFRWAKTISVLLPIIAIGFTRIANYEKKEGWWGIFRKNWIYWFFYIIICLNILEATVKDMVLGNYFNGIAGAILCLTLPLPPKYWKIGKKAPGDFIVSTPLMWAILYTTWNAAFVYSENIGYFASSVCILTAALLYPVIKRRSELYLIARIYTIGIHVLIRASYDIFTPLMDSRVWANPAALKIWGMINCALHVPYLFWYFWGVFSRKSGKQTVPQEL